jgi:hypothetical protein
MLYTSRMQRLSCLLVALVACGGTQAGSTTGGGNGGSAAGGGGAVAGDVAIDLPNTDIKGIVFEPEALGRPGMPMMKAKKPVPLEAQRKKCQVVKDQLQKQAECGVLAYQIYEDAKVKTGEDYKKAISEARQVMRDLTTQYGDKTDDLTWQVLGTYEVMLEDWAGAEKAWAEFVKAQPPKSKQIPFGKAWWAYSLLHEFKNAEALAAIKDDQPSEKEPELAYVIGWAKFRAGDDAGAWQAIVAAAKGWQGGDRAALDRDVMLFASRGRNVSFDQAKQPLFDIFGAKQPAQQYEVLAKLGLQAYQFAGRWADGVAAIDKALATAGGTTPPNDVPVLRYTQADFMVRLDNPEAAAKYAKQALESLAPCGAKCSAKDKQDIVGAISIMGRLFHILYATANDDRYYQPANDIYIAAIPLIDDASRRAEVNRDAETLQRTKKSAKPGSGKHDQSAIGALLGRHAQEVQACYEHTLTTDAKLAGSLTVHLDSDASGAIKGVATEPKAGAGGMSAVASCVAEHAKGWKLPKRGMAGTTRIKLSYALSPKQTAKSAATASSAAPPAKAPPAPPPKSNK